jgi:arabinan endo-1,5-alpha-L-arabinosidase
VSNATYTNPVYRGTCADPFVLKHLDTYWAYRTGFADDGRAIGILRSPDLVRWAPVAGALEPLPEGWPEYWAPEVSYLNGLFYLYYSVGNEEHMEVRVATSRDPAGPFTDSGRRLTHEPFAIDAHIFVDSNGERSLFYATDFLEHTRIGTGTVMDRMIDPFALEGQPRPVTRAKYDWQIYDPCRVEKGSVRWHTVEGPFVLHRHGRYYQMFSGGNWQNPSYGVSYAVTDDLRTSGEWEQHADGVDLLPILRTTRDVIGPGHNSVVRGPDNWQLYCVYHRWVDGVRAMAIDRLEFVGDRLTVLGPTNDPQPAPAHAGIVGFDAWRLAGWTQDGAVYRADRGARAEITVPHPQFLWEIALAGDATASLAGPGDRLLSIELRSRAFALSLDAGDAIVLPAGLEPGELHTLRVAVDGRDVRVWCDEFGIAWQGKLARDVVSLLITGDGDARAGGSAITIGWESDFAVPHAETLHGWTPVDDAAWEVRDGLLRGGGLISHGPVLDACEIVAAVSTDESCTLYPAWRPGDSGPRVSVDAPAGVLTIQSGSQEKSLPLPEGFGDQPSRALRVWRAAGSVAVLTEGGEVSTLPCEPSSGAVAFRAGAIASVRVTALP